MKLSVNDPKITAYALGEIENPEERQAIEAALARAGLALRIERVEALIEAFV